MQAHPTRRAEAIIKALAEQKITGHGQQLVVLALYREGPLLAREIRKVLGWDSYSHLQLHPLIKKGAVARFRQIATATSVERYMITSRIRVAIESAACGGDGPKP